MPTHKVLRAVAHNIGHSFTSLGGYFFDDSWAIQHLVIACRVVGKEVVEIDLLSGVVHPPEIRTDAVLKAAGFLRDHFADMLVRSGSASALVAAATLDLRFRLNEIIPGQPAGHVFAPHVIVPEFIDDRGREHSAVLKEWWRE